MSVISSLSRRPLVWCLVAAVVVGGTLAGLHAAKGDDAKPARTPEPTPLRDVAALGRLEPAGRVVRLAATQGGDGLRVVTLAVAEGQRVEAGAVVATLDLFELRRAGLAEAEAKVSVARARLAQVKAGAKTADVAAKKAALSRLRAMSANADDEFRRAAELFTRGAIGRAEYDHKRTARESAAHDAEQMRAESESVAEVRPVDVAHAEAEVKLAEAAVNTARAQMETNRIRAPFAGRVLRVHAWPGEKVTDRGIVELGDTDVMDAVAEVYECDVKRVAPGQAARVKVPALDETLAATVAHVGVIIAKKDVLNNDPVADTDARVVEVRLRLGPAESARVAGLTNHRVEVRIVGPK